MIWIALFVSQLASGLNARKSLLAFRGGIFNQELRSYTILKHVLELLGTIAAIGGFVSSFAIFPWWIPMVAFVIGFWIVPPFAVNNRTFVFIYAISPLLSILSCGCGAFLVYQYFNS